MSRDGYLVGALVLGASRALAVDVIEDDAPPTDEEIAAAAADAVEQAVEIRPTPQTRVLQSVIEGIDDAAWTKFVLAMRTATPGAVSASNALGMFEMRPRRLGDLGLIENLTRERSATGRMVWTGGWKKPLTQKAFLDSPELQYKAFAASMNRYIDGLREGTIEQPEDGVDDDMSLSGALAILHRCGPQGIKLWGNEDARFNDTIDLYSRANGAF